MFDGAAPSGLRAARFITSERSPVMLVLSRKLGEVIEIGDDIRVMVVSIGRDTVRLGIEAPRGVSVFRSEIGDRIRLEKSQQDLPE